mmetsp:Transcript_11308/g.21798  ORF Transcript_11308/g.21798 Transcript_11308/m.21798 type:complete len:200 (-) Transcript_11308:49-648(-)
MSFQGGDALKGLVREPESKLGGHPSGKCEHAHAAMDELGFPEPPEGVKNVVNILQPESHVVIRFIGRLQISLDGFQPVVEDSTLSLPGLPRQPQRIPRLVCFRPDKKLVLVACPREVIQVINLSNNNLLPLLIQISIDQRSPLQSFPLVRPVVNPATIVNVGIHGDGGGRSTKKTSKDSHRLRESATGRNLKTFLGSKV